MNKNPFRYKTEGASAWNGGKEREIMTAAEVREILCKQLELLAEASEKSGPEYLPALTEAMVQIAKETR